MQGKSTNIVEYKKFLRLVARNVKSSSAKPILLYDGHPAHRNPGAVEVASLYFRPLQQCGYSCCFNAVEAVWGLAKQNFMKRMLLNKGVIEKEFFMELVFDSLNSISAAVHKRLLLSNHAFIRRHL